MRRLCRRLELVAADRVETAGAKEQRFGLVDQPRIPQCGILVGERYVFAVRVASRVAPGIGVQHQRQ